MLPISKIFTKFYYILSFKLQISFQRFSLNQIFLILLFTGLIAGIVKIYIQAGFEGLGSYSDVKIRCSYLKISKFVSFSIQKMSLLNTPFPPVIALHFFNFYFKNLLYIRVPLHEAGRNPNSGKTPQLLKNYTIYKYREHLPCLQILLTRIKQIFKI